MRRKIIIFCFLPLLLLISFSVLYKILVDNALLEGRDFITCSFKNKFHLYCPGCGGSRSLSALLSFKFLKSFILFPALPVAVLILADFYVRAIISFIKNNDKYVKEFKINLLIIIPVVIILNFFIRNVLLFYGIDLIGDFY